ncbi:hypothetical protein HPB52_006796 [Rhipicephalus sanguineus]|uniref:Uncharacterized protein n=1 Tax=Rhipicephalus sanguineus TaxID=34632 RepID=A0A9D4QEX5_RHISA|nr:hypothetical protein HPB52_006796 [Rhipicephalus sanguineus]
MQSPCFFSTRSIDPSRSDGCSRRTEDAHQGRQSRAAATCDPESMNELIEQIRNQESSVSAAATSELAQVTAASTSTSLQQGTIRQNPTEEAGTPSSSRSCSEQTSMPRQLEPLVDLPRDAFNLRTGRIVQMSSSEEQCDCKHDRDLWTHRRRIYCTDVKYLAHKGAPDTGVKLEIELYRP